MRKKSPSVNGVWSVDVARRTLTPTVTPFHDVPMNEEEEEEEKHTHERGGGSYTSCSKTTNVGNSLTLIFNKKKYFFLGNVMSAS